MRGGAWSLIARNFRTRRGEIDVIARDRDTLVFVEVRLRSAGRVRRRSGEHHAGQAHPPARRGARVPRHPRREPPCRFDAILLDGLDAARITWERNILAE